MGSITTSLCINLGGTGGRMMSASLRGGSECVRDSTTFPATTRDLSLARGLYCWTCQRPTVQRQQK